MGYQLPHHGTRARYQHHLRHHEVPCGPCTRANTEDTARRRRALHHTSDTDLYPLIGLLADLLFNPGRSAGSPARPAVREATVWDDPALRYAGVPVSRPQGWAEAS